MNVVQRGITIWILYAFLTFMSVACPSTAEKVTWELVFEPYERIVNRMMSKRLQQFSSADGTPDTFVKRGNVAVTVPLCSCQQNLGVCELEDGHYPQYLPSFTCHGSQWCKELTYPVRVLAKKTITGGNYVYTQDDLPKELIDRGWWFAEYNITVGCACPN